jgi:uncharacterized protein (TIGR01777 family)
MRIVVAGGTGFVGRPLVETLEREGHRVQVLTRRGGSGRDVTWNPDGTVGPWAAALDGADAVVNLAGESIAGGRWTMARRHRIRQSRLDATRSLVGALLQAAARPRILVSASGVDYYGARGDEPLTEASSSGEGFLAALCRDWEAEALRAAPAARVVLLRTGIVLERDGGALPPMALPFRLFAGGPVGSGRQFYPWIHRADYVRMVTWALRTGELSGPLNVTAPNPERQADFARALGRVLGRPSFVPAPAFAMRLALGSGMADALLLGSKRVMPARARDLGFEFTFPLLEPALREIYKSEVRQVR